MEFNNPSLIVKDITTGNEGRKKIIDGVDQLANAVASTLGASGKCVIYEDAMGNPVITKDGVTVAESVVLFDPVENMGATMIKEAAKNTVREAGDGTTTATVLARELLNACTYSEEAKGLPWRRLKSEINYLTDRVLEELDKMAIEVSGEMLESVATISCNNDTKLGKLIANAFEAAGPNGEVLMEEREDETYIEVETVKGSQLQVGLKSQYWRTNIERETAELENPYVLILTSPLNNLRKIENILKFVMGKNKPLLIIGELEQQPLATLLANKVKGVLKVNVVDLPGFGKTKQDTVQDVALITGATPISEELGDDFDFTDYSVLGQCVRSITSSTKTTLQVDTEGLEDKITNRIATIRKQIEAEDNGFLKKKHEERINILSGSVSVIKIGAESKIERKEKKDRIEDAIYAVKAAIKEGIVPGGGKALIEAYTRVLNRPADSPEERIMDQVLRAPFLTILENAGISPDDPLLSAVYRQPDYGVDVVTGELVDMIKHGIIDPVLVTKTALKNAVSVASTILSADAILSNRRIDQ